MQLLRVESFIKNKINAIIFKIRLNKLTLISNYLLPLTIRLKGKEEVGIEDRIK